MRAWLLAAVCCGLAIGYVVAYPPALPQLAGFGAFGMPVAAKVADFCVSLLWLACLNVSAFTLGAAPLAALRRLSRRVESDLDKLTQLGLGWLVLAYLVLLLAAVHLLYSPVLLALALTPAAIGTPWLVRSLRARAAFRSPGWPRPILIVVLVLVGALSLPPIVGAFVPLYGWDAQTLHLALPDRFLRAHRIFMDPLWIYTGLPLTVQMLYTLALGVDQAPLVKLLHGEFGVLALSTLYVLARRISLRAALFAVAIVLADPLFHWELEVAYTDLALCFFVLLAVGSLLEWMDAASPGEAPPDALLARCGVFVGACAAVRVQGGALIFVLALAVALIRPSRDLPRQVGVLVLASGLVFSPWIVRDLAFARAPFALLFPGLRPASVPPYFDPRLVAQMVRFCQDMGTGRGLRSLLELPYTLFFRSRIGFYSDSFGFQVGVLYLLGIVAALSLTAARRSRMTSMALVMGTSMTAIWFFTAQEARYLLPALFVFALPGGIALDALAREGHRTVTWLLVGLCAAGVAYAVLPSLEKLPSACAVALGGISPASVEAMDPAFRASKAVQGALRANDRVLLAYEPRGYEYRDIDYVPYLVLEGAPLQWVLADTKDEGALRCWMAARGVSHVLVNYENLKHLHPILLPGYTAEDFAAGVERLQSFLAHDARPVMRGPDLTLFELGAVPRCGEAESIRKGP